jgi:hypothetical protein
VCGSVGECGQCVRALPSSQVWWLGDTTGARTTAATTTTTTTTTHTTPERQHAGVPAHLRRPLRERPVPAVQRVKLPERDNHIGRVVQADCVCVWVCVCVYYSRPLHAAAAHAAATVAAHAAAP